ncbi:MAG TPA: hypothetical protein VGK73_02180 [Polyangiaceae bacterium]
MRNFAIALLTAVPLVTSVACKKDEQPPPQQPMYAPQAPPGYAPQAPGVQPAPTAPAPAPTAPPVAPAPGPAPTAAGTMSQPSPMALPCTADANCLTHRCNTQFGKCAWPCQSDVDCNPGNRCMGGACVPATQ